MLLPLLWIAQLVRQQFAAAQFRFFGEACFLVNRRDFIISQRQPNVCLSNFHFRSDPKSANNNSTPPPPPTPRSAASPAPRRPYSVRQGNCQPKMANEKHKSAVRNFGNLITNCLLWTYSVIPHFISTYWQTHKRLKPETCLVRSENFSQMIKIDVGLICGLNGRLSAKSVQVCCFCCWVLKYRSAKANAKLTN